MNQSFNFDVILDWEFLKPYLATLFKKKGENVVSGNPIGKLDYVVGTILQVNITGSYSQAMLKPLELTI